MKKHVDIMKAINTGEPFDCTYVKISTGEKLTFEGLRKCIRTAADKIASAAADHTKRRKAHSHTSLTPFFCQDDSIVELYTRLFIKFNGEDVAL